MLPDETLQTQPHPQSLIEDGSSPHRTTGAARIAATKHFLAQTLDREALVVRIGLVARKLRQVPSHPTSSDCSLRLRDWLGALMRSDQRVECLTVSCWIAETERSQRIDALLPMETESARGVTDLLAMEGGSQYCLSGELGEDALGTCFLIVLL